MVCVYHSPDLNLMIRIEQGVLTEIDFISPAHPVAPGKAADHGSVKNPDQLVTDIFRQMEEYQSRLRQTFDLPYKLTGTQFQMMVWEALMSIPYGHTVSYSDVASLIGRQNSVRAVANAIGSNPIPILVPCHRVIGKNGKLRGFGGGLPIKQYLLDLEQ